jgi:lysophospholipase L1-like esterase
LQIARLRISGATLVVCAFCLCAFSQGTVPTETVSPSLQQYRESRVDMFLNDYGQLYRYRQADAGLKPPAPDQDRVVFFGDSITDIWHLPDYFPGKPYINRGIGGQTTPQMLVRYRQDVIDLHPKVVVILAGTNDIAGNTGPERVEDIEANFATFSELARLHHIRVVFSSVTPINDYVPAKHDFFADRSMSKILALNRWIKAYCAKTGDIYLDYFSALADKNGMMKKDLSNDGLHPNAAGFKVMAPLAEKAIEKALGKAAPSN